MKAPFTIFLAVCSFYSFSQANTPRSAPAQQGNNGQNLNSTTQNPRAINAASASPGGGRITPFTGGGYSNGNAGTGRVSSNTNNTTSNRISPGTPITAIPRIGDTTYNINTINQSATTTSPGATDRSGQAQFGQTNWGQTRSTVGESQWTIPPPISASFNREFPAGDNTTWSRSNADSSIYSAKHKSTTGGWVITNYRASGEKLDRKAEVPEFQASRPVSIFLAKQPPGFDIATVYKLEMQGKPEMYEIQTKSGKTIYINENGVEVNY